MESVSMNQKEFAQFTGINAATLNGIFNDRTRPTLQTVEALHKHFPKISLDWLMFGTGPMEVSQDSVEGSDLSAASQEPTSTVPSGSAPLLFDHLQSEQPARANEFSKERQEPVIKYIDKPQRHITEIRIFYDDQTWESFTPKK